MEPITDEKFEEQVPDVLNRGTLATDLIALADRDGLDAKEHFPEQFGGVGIEKIKAFIILLKLPYPLKPHGVAMVYSEAKKGFCLSDSADQDKAVHEIYSRIAGEALREYQRSNDFIVHSVVSFHERVYDHGVAPQLHTPTSAWPTRTRCAPPPYTERPARPATVLPSEQSRNHSLESLPLRERKRDKFVRAASKAKDVGKEVFHLITANSFKDDGPSDAYLDRERNYYNLPLR